MSHPSCRVLIIAYTEGFEDIEDTLLEFSNKLKDAENASHEGKKKHEMLWPVFQITHQRTYLFTAHIKNSRTKHDTMHMTNLLAPCS